MTNLAGYGDHEKVSAIRYEQPSLTTDNPIFFEPKGLWTPKVDEDNIAYASMWKPFNLNQYLYPRPPIDLGLLDVTDCPVNVLRMPLKFPKSSTWMTPGNQYRIPRALKKLMPIIERVSEYEKFINPNHDSWFCHITFDHSRVKAGEHHRFPGFHGDGIQGTKLTPKEIVEHSYIMATSPSTEFCLQPFFLKHLDEAKHNFFLEFDRQAKETNVYGSLPNHLYLIDPYMVHRTPKIKYEQDRVFLRITYSPIELQHPKNTNNPLFEGQEYRERVDIRQNLCPNEFEVPLHLYGLTNGNR